MSDLLAPVSFCLQGQIIDKARDVIKPDGLGFTIINLLMFQAGWLLCVLAGSSWALIYTLLASAVHFAICSHRRRDFLLASIALAIGAFHDNALQLAGVINFQTPLAPAWILCLWWLMGLTLAHSLRPVYQRMWLSSVLGAMAGALAYAGGVALSPANWGVSLPLGLVIVACLWLFVLPLHKYLMGLVEHTGYVR